MDKIFNIPISKISFTQEDFENIIKPLKSGWVLQGPYVKEFEKKWCEFTGAKNSIAVSSCTTALHLSLAALGINENDEVIVPTFTWIATANAVEYVNAKPVFCDIELKNFNIDTNIVSNYINTKTKAIIPVHLFGLSADMNKLSNVIKNKNIFIIEDAACGFGTKYFNKHVGNFGKIGCFSFHPRKALSTGEGGMVTTNDDELAEKLRSLRDHGSTLSESQKRDGAKPYLLPHFASLGYNYRMTDIQGVLGSSQMDRANMILQKRKKIAEMYDTIFEKIKWMKYPKINDNFVHSYQAYVCLMETEELNLRNVNKINSDRNTFMDYLQKNGIATRPGTHAVHNLEYYKRKYKLNPEDFPNSFIADKCSIAFPIFPDLTIEEIKYIEKIISGFKL